MQSIRNYLKPESGRLCVLAPLLLVTMLLIGAGSPVVAREHGATDSVSATASSAYLKHSPVAGSSATNSSATNDALAGYMSHESLFPSFLKITLALVAVIAGIYLTLAALKKAMGRKVSSGAHGNALEALETCYLAPKRSVTLVRVGRRAALLSVTDSAITTLLELSAEEMAEIVESAGSPASAPDFRHSLQRAKQKIVNLGSYALKHRQEASSGSAG